MRLTRAQASLVTPNMPAAAKEAFWTNCQSIGHVTLTQRSASQWKICIQDLVGISALAGQATQRESALSHSADTTQPGMGSTTPTEKKIFWCVAAISCAMKSATSLDCDTASTMSVLWMALTALKSNVMEASAFYALFATKNSNKTSSLTLLSDLDAWQMSVMSSVLTRKQQYTESYCKTLRPQASNPSSLKQQWHAYR